MGITELNFKKKSFCFCRNTWWCVSDDMIHMISETGFQRIWKGVWNRVTEEIRSSLFWKILTLGYGYMTLDYFIISTSVYVWTIPIATIKEKETKKTHLSLQCWVIHALWVFPFLPAVAFLTVLYWVQLSWEVHLFGSLGVGDRWNQKLFKRK